MSNNSKIFLIYLTEIELIEEIFKNNKNEYEIGTTFKYGNFT